MKPSGHSRRPLLDSAPEPPPKSDLRGDRLAIDDVAQMKKHATPHMWRQTCVTHRGQDQAHLRHVEDLLGHRSLATTERYLRLTITDPEEAHAKYHPREQTDRLRRLARTNGNADILAA